MAKMCERYLSASFYFIEQVNYYSTSKKIKMKIFSKICTTILVILFSSQLSMSYATDLRWIGVGNGNWNDASKWKFTSNLPCFCIPGSTDNVEIVTGEVTVPNGYTAAARTVRIFANTKLHVGTSSTSTSILNVGPANGNGVVVDQNGLVQINASDQLNISGITNSASNISALRNSGDFNLLASSQLNIENCGADGIYNSGQGSDLNNKGTITIDNLQLAGSDGIFNGLDGFITNEANGEITINDISGAGSEGIDNRYAFVNFGTINIDDVQNASGLSSALHPSAIFANHSILNISNIKGRGIWVHSSGEFLNKPSGKLSIDNIIGNDAVSVLQTFENEGILTIKNVEGANSQGIYNERTFVNDGDISIEDIEDHGILNTSFFTNNAGATIDVDIFGDEGFRNEATGVLTNNGTLIINQNTSALNSHGLMNYGDITNNNDIRISRIFGDQSEGIQNFGTIVGDNGDLTINNVTDSGIKNINGGTINLTKTDITITNCDIGIENEGSFTYDGIGSIMNCADFGIINGENAKFILDEGEMNIDGSAEGLHVDNLFTIEACFELIIKDKMHFDHNASFTNDGFIFQDYLSINSTGVATSFINNGVIEDRHQSFRTGVSFITHNGLYAGPLEGNHIMGFISQSVLIGDGVGLSKSHYFAEPALANSVGLVQTAIHEWLPSAIINVVYMEIDNGCMKRVIQQDLESTVYHDCFEVPDANQVINYDPTFSEDKGWFYPYNWDTHQVPNFCSDIHIDAPYSIIVDPAYRAMGRTLDLKLGVDFEASGILHIENFD